MKIKTQNLTGRALDWAVAEAYYQKSPPLKSHFFVLHKHGKMTYPYSTAWDWGGPIIEREEVLFTRTNDGEMYHAWIVRLNASATGPTHLTAAMRCFVESRLGDEVDVPEELI